LLFESTTDPIEPFDRGSLVGLGIAGGMQHA